VRTIVAALIGLISELYSRRMERPFSPAGRNAVTGASSGIDNAVGHAGD
jgi:hypothetical protein